MPTFWPVGTFSIMVVMGDLRPWKCIRLTRHYILEAPTCRQDGRTGVRRSYRPGPTSLPSPPATRSEEHTSELQSLMRISYAVFCLKKKKNNKSNKTSRHLMYILYTITIHTINTLQTTYTTRYRMLTI